MKIMTALRRLFCHPAAVRPRTTIETTLIDALEAFLGAPDSQSVRDTLRASLQRYIDASAVTR